MSRTAGAQAWVEDDRMENEPFELSQTRVRAYPASRADLDEELALLPPYEEQPEIWEEDEIDPTWQAGSVRRAGIKALGWVGIAGAVLGTLLLSVSAPARGAIASWATMGHVT